MEDLRNPATNFLHHVDYEKKPESVKMAANTSRTEQTLEFNFRHLPLLWRNIVGPELLMPMNVLHVNSSLVWYLASDLWLHGYLKGVHLKLTPEHLKFTQKNCSADELQEKATFLCKTSVGYVGDRTFGLATQGHRKSDNLPIFQYENIMYPLDLTTGKLYKKLPEEWKSKFTNTLQLQGIENKRLEFPPFPRSTRVIHSEKMKIHNEHVDENCHANYKIYLLGSIASLSEAHKVLPREIRDRCIRDVVVCFEKESKQGDDIRFDVLLPENEELSVFVAAYLDEKRLSYCRIQLADRVSQTSRL